MPCQARAESDQYRCALCRIVWDRNDPDPPKCPQENKTFPEEIKNENELLRRQFVHHTRKQGLLSWDEAIQLHERMYNAKILL